MNKSGIVCQSKLVYTGKNSNIMEYENVINLCGWVLGFMNTKNNCRLGLIIRESAHFTLIDNDHC